LKRTAKEVRRGFKDEGSEVRRAIKCKLKHRVFTLGLDQIIKFIYRLDGPLGEGKV
jgi:hypothetical protein